MVDIWRSSVFFFRFVLFLCSADQTNAKRERIPVKGRKNKVQCQANDLWRVFINTAEEDLNIMGNEEVETCRRLQAGRHHYVLGDEPIVLFWGYTDTQIIEFHGIAVGTDLTLFLETGKSCLGRTNKEAITRTLGLLFCA